MFKINWGTGIAIFYTLFVVVMVSAVVMSSRMGVDLVQEQYYDADIAYESFRQKRANAEDLDKTPAVSVHHKSQFINIDFDNMWSEVEGTIQLYCPSDDDSDITYKIKLEEGQMNLPIGELKKGRWKVLLNWDGDGTSYYTENNIMI
jgi:hypothetical protein